MHRLILMMMVCTMNIMPKSNDRQISNLQIFNKAYLTENVLDVISSIRKYTDKKICVYDIKTFPDKRFQNFKNYFGISSDKGENIEIWLSENFPEQVLVHELLHILLRLEGFPEIYRNENYIRETVGTSNINLIDNIQSILSSTIDHQIIYTRMKDNEKLEPESYIQALIEMKFKRLHKTEQGSKKYRNIEIFYRQQDLFVLFDLHIFGELSKKLQIEYSKMHPELVSFFNTLNTSVQKIGFDSPIQAKKSADYIITSIIRFGDVNNLDRRINNLWRCLFVK